MAQITAAAVKELRSITDMPMMECKKALTEAEGDQEKAIAILKEAHKKISIKRQDNVTAEGQVFVAVADDNSKAAMVEIQCESAPVGSGEDLTNFGNELVETLLNDDSIDSVETLLSKSGSAGKPFSEQFDDMVGKIREKIVVNRCVRVNGPVAGYVHHDRKTGVLVTAEGDNASSPVLRDVGMHIAALRPTVVVPEELDAANVKAERDRLSEEARATGKPENIIEKIVDGRMNSYYVEQGVLTLQPFAKDDSKSVSQALSEQGLKAKAFHLYKIGAE